MAAAHRQDPRAGLTAAATSALLAMDAWFDVLTAAPGADRVTAIVTALGAELPLAVLCACLAVRSGAEARAALAGEALNATMTSATAMENTPEPRE